METNAAPSTGSGDGNPTNPPFNPPAAPTPLPEPLAVFPLSATGDEPLDTTHTRLTTAFAAVTTFSNALLAYFAAFFALTNQRHQLLADKYEELRIALEQLSHSEPEAMDQDEPAAAPAAAQGGNSRSTAKASEPDKWLGPTASFRGEPPVGMEPWLSQVRTYLDVVPTEQPFAFAASYLRGDALVRFNGLSGRGPHTGKTFEQFCAILRVCFPETHPASAAYHNIHTSTMSTEDPTAYLRDFMRDLAILKAAGRPIGAENALDCLLKGVLAQYRPLLASYIVNMSPDVKQSEAGIEEAHKQATSLIQNSPPIAAVPSLRTANAGQRVPSRRYKGKRPQPAAQPAAQPAIGSFSPVCDNCSAPGHLSIECKKPIDKDRVRVNRNKRLGNAVDAPASSGRYRNKRAK
jgi:hypothetical protein